MDRQYITNRIQNFCICDVMRIADNISLQTVKDSSLQWHGHFPERGSETF